MYIEKEFNNYINKKEKELMVDIMKNINTKDELLSLNPTKQVLYDYSDSSSFLYIVNNHVVACESFIKKVIKI